MRDGNKDAPDSAVTQVAALKIGESYARTRFIPAFDVTPDKIRNAKSRLLSTMAPVIARAKSRLDNDAYYKVHSFHVMAPDCGVIVAAVVIREPEL